MKLKVTADLLTETEHEFMQATVQLINLYRRICGSGPTLQGDLEEFCADIHKIQYRVLAQAAARAYPDRYRLLGEV